MTSFVDFSGTNPPIDQLPKDFRQAILNSEAGKQTPTDDNVIGSAASGSGYCAQDNFKQQLYCACVNAPVANPECIFNVCANQGAAYKTVQMQRVVENAQKMCPTTINCTQIIEMGGAGNVSSNITQTLNCGGIIDIFTTNIQAHPFLSIVILILILSMVMLVSGSRKKPSEGRSLPPPELVIPENI